jgi:hypothetical protein
MVRPRDLPQPVREHTAHQPAMFAPPEPGPAPHDYQNPLRETRDEKLGVFTREPRPELFPSIGAAPGPKYTPSVALTKPSLRGGSFGKAPRIARAPRTEGADLLLNLPSTLRLGFGPVIRSATRPLSRLPAPQGGPGPGAYTPQLPARPGYTSPTIGGTAHENPARPLDSGSPGHSYALADLDRVRARSTFNVRISKSERFQTAAADRERRPGVGTYDTDSAWSHVERSRSALLYLGG